MKKILLFVAFIGITALSSCEGPEGPPGEPGYSAESAVYELTGVDFIPDDFAILFTFPQPILASDHVLVYRLSSTFQGEDVWQLMPQYYYFADGTMDFGYNYDFTRFDVNVFLDGNDLGTLNTSFTQNQVLRIVVVPGYFDRSAVDVRDIDAVSRALGLVKKDIQVVRDIKTKS